MTHFASAADYSSTQTADQLAYFERIAAAIELAGHRGLRLHTSSTNAIAYGVQTPATTWCAPATRFTGTFLRRAGKRLRSASMFSRRSPGKPAAGGQGVTVRARWSVTAARFARRGRCGSACSAPVTRMHLPPALEPRPGDRGGKLTPILGTIRWTSPPSTSATPARWARRRSDPTRPGRRGAAGRAADRACGRHDLYNILCSISARVRRVYV